MALVLADRVLETTSVAGTGDATLNGAQANYQPFSVIGNGNTTYYTIVDNTNNEWEVGIGTYVLAGNYISRDTVLSSSNGGALVYFPSGDKDIFLDLPSEMLPDGDVVGPASAVANNFAAFNLTTGKLIKDSGYNASSFATAAQGAKADTAVQPGSLATVATTGSYTDLSNKPTLGTAAALNAGVAGGVATLDGGGTVPTSQLPAAVLGAVKYQGTWDASTNTPTLTSGVGTQGYYYVVSTAGSTNLDGITSWAVGDWAIYNGTAWQKIDNTDAVTSVNGFTGTVVLTASDVGATPATSGTSILYGNGSGGTSNVTVGTGLTFAGGTLASTAAGGDVVGPASSTDNAIARFDLTTGKLIQNSGVIIDDSNNVSGVNTLTTTNLIVNDDTTLGGSNADSIAVNARITTDLEPATNNAKDIGTSGRNWRDGFFGRNLDTVNLSVTGTTSFDGSQGTAGQVLTSAGTGATPTWTTPTTGTVTSVTGTAPIASSGGATPAISISQATTSTDGYLSSTDWNTFNGKGSGTVTSVGGTGTVNGITLTGTVTSSGNLTLGGTLGGIGNSQLTNSAVTVGTTAISLGSSSTTLAGLTSVSSTNLTASDTVTGSVVSATNGLMINNMTIGASYAIPSGYSASSVGAVTIASGVSVTVPSGSRWVVL